MAESKKNKSQYRHHFTPNEYLRNFIPTGANVFRVYDIVNGKTWEDNGTNTGWERDLHSVGKIEIAADGSEVNKLEEFLTWEENEANPIYKRWIAEEKIVDELDRAKMGANLVILFLRNPKQLENITESKLRTCVEEMKKRCRQGDMAFFRKHIAPEKALHWNSMPDKELRALLLEEINTSKFRIDKKAGFWEGLDSDQVFGSMALFLSGMDWSLVRSAPDSEFVTSDNSAVFRLYPPTDKERTGMIQGVFHSLSPQLCLVLSPDGSGEGRRQVGAKTVDTINRIIIQQAIRKIVSSVYDPHVCKLVREEARLRGIEWPKSVSEGEK